MWISFRYVSHLTESGTPRWSDDDSGGIVKQFKSCETSGSKARSMRDLLTFGLEFKKSYKANC